MAEGHRLGHAVPDFQGQVKVCGVFRSSHGRGRHSVSILSSVVEPHREPRVTRTRPTHPAVHYTLYPYKRQTSGTQALAAGPPESMRSFKPCLGKT